MRLSRSTKLVLSAIILYIGVTTAVAPSALLNRQTSCLLNRCNPTTANSCCPGATCVEVAITGVSTLCLPGVCPTPCMSDGDCQHCDAPERLTFTCTQPLGREVPGYCQSGIL